MSDLNVSAASSKINSYISAVRTPLMGIAIIMIMLFHSDFGVLGYLNKPFAHYGHWAVDIFLFLSGFGIFFSLKNNKGTSFYARRFIRIIPAAVIAGNFVLYSGHADILGIFGLNLWYIRTIIILYLLSPLLYYLLTNKRPQKVLLYTILACLLSLTILVPQLYTSDSLYQSTICWTIARLPSFALGMYIARQDISFKSILQPSRIFLAIACLLIAIFLQKERNPSNLINLILHLQVYTLVALLLPLAITIFSYAYSSIKQITATKLIFSFLGSYSLELYLVHETIFKIVAKLQILPISKFLSAYFLSFVCAVMLKIIANQLTKLIILPFNKVKS